MPNNGHWPFGSLCCIGIIIRGSVRVAVAWRAPLNRRRASSKRPDRRIPVYRLGGPPRSDNSDAYGATVVRELIAGRRVFPVLDGLDELDPGARAQPLRMLNKHSGVKIP